MTKFSVLADWVLYLGPFPNVRLTHHPDDGGSKDLWNVGKLLPDQNGATTQKTAIFKWSINYTNHWSQYNYLQ
jgi:hypothetical protein